MTSASIVFATCRDRPGFTDDDQLAVRELERRGRAVKAVPWDTPDENWAAADAVVIRSTWDYVRRIDEFRAWLSELERQRARVLNRIDVLRGNLDKRYLQTLEKSGIPIVRTRWIPYSGFPMLADALLEATHEFGTKDLIVKPAVSAGAHLTFRTRVRSRRECGLDPRQAEGYRPGEIVMIQPFAPTILTDGEWSLLFFGDRFSHAIRKRPKAGDFRVQNEFGGSIEAGEPPPGAREIAERAVLSLAPLLYARADFVRDGREWVLGELELTEPSLYLAHDPLAAARFAEALVESIAPAARA